MFTLASTQVEFTTLFYVVNEHDGFIAFESTDERMARRRCDTLNKKYGRREAA